jgi:hypothetical protein
MLLGRSVPTFQIRAALIIWELAAGASTSETSVNFTKLHGFTTKKTVICILAAMKILRFY